MSPVPVFTGRVEADGRFHADHKAALTRYMRTLGGTRAELVVRRARAQRTNAQNRYYFGVVCALLGEHCGYDVQEMHEVLAFRFLRIEDCPITRAPRRRHTPDTNTVEFSEYVEHCRRFAAELGVCIPDPNEVEV